MHLPRSVRIGKKCARGLESDMDLWKLANNTYLLLKGIPRPIRGTISCNGADADINRY